MKIIVLGAGAIGSFYGAKLSKSNDVLLIAKKEHADSINKNGLMISGLKNKTYTLKALSKVDKIEDDTLIILSTKVQDSEKAVESIKDLVMKNTIILCLQNGLNSENIVREIVKGRCMVLRAVTNYGVCFLEPGKVEFSGGTGTLIESSEHSENLAEIFSDCGLNGKVSGDIHRDVWKKLILNCVLNPLTTILRIENREITNKKLNPAKKAIIDECVRIAEKDGIKFDFDFLEFINKNLKDSKNRSSMLQDVLKGKGTEIDYLNGAVVALGRKYGMNCPVNEALVNIIKNI